MHQKSRLSNKYGSLASLCQYHNLMSVRAVTSWHLPCAYQHDTFLSAPPDPTLYNSHILYAVNRLKYRFLPCTLPIVLYLFRHAIVGFDTAIQTPCHVTVLQAGVRTNRIALFMKSCSVASSDWRVTNETAVIIIFFFSIRFPLSYVICVCS